MPLLPNMLFALTRASPFVVAIGMLELFRARHRAAFSGPLRGLVVAGALAGPFATAIAWVIVWGASGA